ncbi:DUF1273 family protein [Allobacillus sp. SKP2-8]|uniref:SLOG family protein n=1 Tax=unclassified Allobacillus TaxID=2628859 RepID=UPI001182E567|nr:SLOG family protein [Allobacillus sp. SKP2-8]TSJ69067.1 DUF1273 family protein [Allobacillus sp. SKP2-8]
MTMNAITITGYKPYELNIRDDKDEKILVIKEAIKRSLLRYLENGVEWVLLSGQPGVETWAFDLIQELKEAYTIYTAIVPPFMEQEKVWKEPVQDKYYQMIQQADFYQPLMNKPYEHPRQYVTKDKWFIEKTDACILVYEEEHGGSPKYFEELARTYQESHMYEMDVISSFTLEDIAREMNEL